MRGPSTFRRQSQRVEHRRSPIGLRFLRFLLKLVLTVGGPVALATWFLTSDTFRLLETVVTASPRVEAAWVEAQLAPEIGTNLMLLRLGRIEESLKSHPWVESVSLRKELPDRLHVAVVDRQAAAILETEGGRFFVDRRGRRIEAVRPGSIGDEALLSLRVATPVRHQTERWRGAEPTQLRTAFEVRDLLASSDPSWQATLERIEILSDGSFRIRSRDFPFPMLVQAEGLGLKMRIFASQMPAILRRVGRIEAVDLRIEGRIVVIPGTDETSVTSTVTRG